MAQGQTTALRLLPARQPLGGLDTSDALGDWQPIPNWLAEAPQIRQAVERLTAIDDRSAILIPVIVRAESPQRAK